TLHNGLCMRCAHCCTNHCSATHCGLTPALAQTKRSKHKTQIGRFCLLKTSRERHVLDLAGKASKSSLCFAVIRIGSDLGWIVVLVGRLLCKFKFVVFGFGLFVCCFQLWHTICWSVCNCFWVKMCGHFLRLFPNHSGFSENSG